MIKNIFANNYKKVFTLGLTAVFIMSIMSGLFVGTQQVFAATTSSLVPTSNGFYTAWSGDVNDVNETSNFDCGSDDSIKSTGSNSRESFVVSIASIPDDATITSVDITVRDRGDDDPEGTYKTFARLNGADTDSVSNLTATGGSGNPCSSPKTQNINVPDIVKSGATILEIGVIKINSSGHANRTVRVGTITAIITYTPVPSAVCGNSIIEGTEVCDDSNTNNGDGCSSTCTVESGYNCAGSPSICTPNCSGVDNCNAPTQGTCVAPNTCSCSSGWKGANCNTPDCSSLNNCNGHGDCTGPNTCSCNSLWQGTDCSQPACVDVDGDGYGSPASASCTHPELDCNDSNLAINPGVTEVCNGVDDNCDTQIDEGEVCSQSSYYCDNDVDTFISATPSGNCNTYNCVPSGCITNQGNDCDDTNSNVYPGAMEVCNGVDDNCNSSIDEGVQSTFFQDLDGDTYGNGNVNTQACSAPTDYVTDNTDCDDTNSAVHPGATEVCDGLDNNCVDGTDDEYLLKTQFYWDSDSDNYGNPDNGGYECSVPSGAVVDNTDCDDTNSAINPGATEVCGNGIDEDCSGSDSTCDPFCGDGNIDSGEECDPPLTTTPGPQDTSFCSQQCKLVPIYQGGTSCPAETNPVQLEGYPIDILGNDIDGQTITLTGGKTYLFNTSGTFRSSSGAHKSDAGYTTIDDWANLATQFGIQGTPPDYAAHALLGDLGLGVGVINWGNYNSDHIYDFSYTIPTASAQFVIGDRYSDWFDTINKNQIGMGDNSGSLNLNVYECVPETPPAETGSITACKYYDTNKDGEYDQGTDTPLAWNITLWYYLDPAGPGEPIHSTTTDSTTGCVIFNDLLYGTYTVHEDHIDGWQQTAPHPDISPQIVISSTNTNTVIFLNYSLTASIAGYKVNDLDDDGFYDTSDPDEADGMVNWKIYLDLNDNEQFDEGEPFQITDGVGFYRFESVNVGGYQICEVMKSGWASDNPLCQSINVQQDVEHQYDHEARADFFNYEISTGTIKGYKYNDLDYDGEFDQGEPGMGGWNIWVDLNDNGIYDGIDWQTTTDGGAGGLYLFPPVPVGTYDVCEILDEYHPSWANSGPICREVVVTDGNIVTADFFNYVSTASSLTLVKEVIGGNATTSDWTLFAASGPVVLTGPGPTISSSTIPANTYTLSEAPADPSSNITDGYIDSDWVCTGSFTDTDTNDNEHGKHITIGPGDNATCTITNTYILGSLYICKYEDNGEINMYEPDIDTPLAWEMRVQKPNQTFIDPNPITSSETGCILIEDLPFGQYFISELPETGYRQTHPLDPNTYTVVLDAQNPDASVYFLNFKESPPQKYVCDTSTWTCSVSETGQYDTRASCEAACYAPITTTTTTVPPTGPGPTGSYVPVVAGAATEQGQVAGVSTTCGPYLLKFIKLGADNDPVEVKKLQSFLNGYLGLNLPVNGIYDQATYEAVKQFQLLLKNEVLAPWVVINCLPSEDIATGYVYRTTTRAINNILCPTPIPDVSDERCVGGIIIGFGEEEGVVLEGGTVLGEATTTPTTTTETIPSETTETTVTPETGVVKPSQNWLWILMGSILIGGAVYLVYRRKK